jgi:hydrogenase-4 component E
MSVALVWAVVGLGLLALVARRRSAAVAIVTIQSLAVAGGALALAPGRPGEFLVAGLLLAARAAALGLLLGVAVARTREARPVREDTTAVVRLGAGVGLVLLLVALVPPLGLEPAAAGQAAVALVGLGIALVVARRAALFQVLGFLVAENGIAVAAASVGGGLPVLIELGTAVDLILLVVVATVFHERIFGAFGTTDTAVLGALRD